MHGYQEIARDDVQLVMDHGQLPVSMENRYMSRFGLSNYGQCILIIVSEARTKQARNLLGRFNVVH